MSARGMREAELRDVADCGVCGKPFGHTSLPVFWRVRAVRYGVDTNAIRRVDGLAAVFGVPELARIMGDDPVIAAPLSEREITVCETCASKATIIEAGLS